MRCTFLHISKTGGTALGDVLEAHRDKVLKRGHGRRLEDVNAERPVMFVVREPVDRFVSGFNSRLRQGQPRHNLPWSASERVAFERFTNPNMLAEALSSDDAEERAAAVEAMNGIRHSARALTYTLGTLEEFRSRSGQVVWIGHQPTLTADFEALKIIIGLPADLGLPTDPVRSHATPEGFSAKLSDTGRANIAGWYKDDYPVYEECLRLREELLKDPRPLAEPVAG